MAQSLKELKSNRSKAIETLTAEMNKGSTKREVDDRFWKPTVDKSGNGYAVIRFLPAPKGEDVPWVKYFDHGFQGPGGWYIEKSLNSIGQKDPVSEHYFNLKNAGDEEGAKKFSRRTHFVANILVVKDPGAPENEGKVKLFMYGIKINDKIQAKLAPEYEDDPQVNVFDPWDGANFRLKIRNKAGYRNYDESTFDSPSAIGSDEEIEEIWNQEFPLQPLMDPSNFKSYNELKAKLNTVNGTAVTNVDEEDLVVAEPKGKTAKAKPAPKVEEDEDDDFFQSLVDDE